MYVALQIYRNFPHLNAVPGLLRTPYSLWDSVLGYTFRQKFQNFFGSRIFRKEHSGHPELMS